MGRAPSRATRAQSISPRDPPPSTATDSQGLDLGAAHGVDAASQRLGHRREVGIESRRKMVEVLGDDPRRNEHHLGEAPQEVEQVLTQAESFLAAVEAGAARGGVRAEHPVAQVETLHSLANSPDLPGELMPESHWVPLRRGVAPPEHLHVGSACEGRRHPEDDFARPGLRLGEVLDPKLSGTVQERRPHVPSTTTLTAFPDLAVSNARAVSASGNRWVMIPSPDTAPSDNRRSASRVSMGPAE